MLLDQRDIPQPVLQYSEYADFNAPSIVDMPKAQWDAEVKACVLDYMFSGENFLATSMMRTPKNAFTGGDLVEGIANFGDDCWYWRGDLPLYIRDYNIAIPEDFIEHVLSRMQENSGLYTPLFDWRRKRHPYEPLGLLARRQKEDLQNTN